MKLTNYPDSIRNHREVVLPRDRPMQDVVLRVYALPPDYGDELERDLPTPKPRVKSLLRDGKGRVEFGKDGQPIKLLEDDSQEYLDKLRQIQQLQTIKMVADSLDPDEVTFETNKNGQAPIAYYTNIRDELKQAGFSAGDLAALTKAVSEVSNINADEILKARQDFFEEESSRASTPSSPSVSDSTGATNASGRDSAIESEPAGLPSSN